MNCNLHRNLFVSFAVALFLSNGCATRRYVGPTTGRSADMQKTTSMALDKSLQGFYFSKYQGKRVYLEVVSLADNFGGESPENSVIREAFVEKLAMDGLKVVLSPSEADIRIAVRARVVGVNMVRRDLPFLYYRETTMAVTDLHTTIFLSGDWTLLDAQDSRRTLYLAQSYWFYMIGPFESLSWE